ncbi:hypothetical protein ANANG_G00061440 [Anguilla anguilla]|uniref:Integral membrane protein 2 n=2 Tax=Anguilla anguilla TaxID=7936 RepID=A0A9D3MNU8_ANGAN|nr:hypothetical protein ANANG_G00061440 [Anguilla anguilla]
MVKVSFNSSLGQKEPNKEVENSEVLIPESRELENGVSVWRQCRAWCMCLGLAIMLSGVVAGGVCLYRYLAPKERLFFCGVRGEDIEEDFMVWDRDMAVPSRLRDIQETIRVLQDDEVELIDVPMPEFGDSDPAKIVHDFPRRLTAYLDLKLNRCYIIPLNTSIVMPPKDFLQLLDNYKAGMYLPQSYVVHEQMMVTERVDSVDLGYFIRSLCYGKETYRLQRRDTVLGMQKREVQICHKIIHFENTFGVVTTICEPRIMVSSASSQRHLILLLLLNVLFVLGCC